MSAAALLTVQMAITAVVPGADAPVPPPSARPPDPLDPYGPPGGGLPDRAPERVPERLPDRLPGRLPDRLAGGPAGELGAGQIRVEQAPASWPRAGRPHAGAFRLVSVADRKDAGSGGYGRASGLVKLLGMKSDTRALDRPQRPQFRSYARLPHRFAAQRLREVGIKRRSTGRCTSKRRPTCTSYAAIRANTVARLVRLKRRSKCPIVVTGGTEIGHAHGRHSHGNGYKIDIATNRCVDAYIKKTHKRIGTRADGAALYASGRRGNRDVFARESNHWDIIFR